MRIHRRMQRALRLDRERFAEVERLAIYEIANSILLAQSALQRAFELRAEEFQIFYLVAIATAQRHVRGASAAAAKLDTTPLAQLSREGVTIDLARQQASLTNTLIHLGVLVEGPAGPADLCAIPTRKDQSASAQISTASPPSSDSSSRDAAP